MVESSGGALAAMEKGMAAADGPQPDADFCDKRDSNPLLAPPPPWRDGDPASDLLRASLQVAIDVLGSTEARNVCRSYLDPVEADATVRRVTVTNACVATAPPHGDVFVPAAVVAEELAVVGTHLRLSMVQTRTGRSAFLALSAEEAEDEGWRVASSKRGRGSRTSLGAPLEKGRGSKGGGKGGKGGKGGRGSGDDRRTLHR